MTPTTMLLIWYVPGLIAALLVFWAGHATDAEKCLATEEYSRPRVPDNLAVPKNVLLILFFASVIPALILWTGIRYGYEAIAAGARSITR